MSLRSLNLNLIPVLRVLLREVNVARASAILGLSRSATSEALGKLRDALDDPLLVQAGRHMELTPRARELIEPVEQLCASAELLLHRQAFEPATSSRRFVIATSDYGVRLVAPQALDLRRRLAPGLRFGFIEPPRDVGLGLSRQDFDFALLARFYVEGLDADFLRFVPLYRHGMSVVFGSDHPLAACAPLTLADLQAHPMVAVSPEPGVVDKRRLDTMFGPVEFDVVASVQHVTLLIPLVLRSDCWSIVPTGLVQARPGLEVRPSPFASPPNIDMCLVWSVVNDADAAHRWFRDTLVQRLGGSSVEPPGAVPAPKRAQGSP